MLALIPARAGSKGLPGKNTLMLNGKPLISYSIEAALKAQNIDRVVVTTDCQEIAQIAQSFGAEVPFIREEYLSTDTAKAIDVYLDATKRLFDKNGIENSLCVLLPTCPLREYFDIDASIDIFYKKKADSVISYTKESHPIKWNKYIDKNGQFENIFPDTIENRQTQRTSFYPNGAIYVFREALLKSNKYYSEKSYSYLMPNERSIDIDTYNDFKYAEFLINYHQKKAPEV
jgi:CMP-N,N'-diacetyllegionaminic acid synthase